jgi:hypothetical protein
VPDKNGSCTRKSGIAEYVIGMAVRVDDLTDRLVGPRPNSSNELPPFANAATGIDDCDGVASDDKTDIGDRAFVLARHQLNRPDVNENAGRDFADVQCGLLRLCSRQNEERRKREADKHLFSFKTATHGSVCVATGAAN